MARIGILTGGGDCPGLNSVIRAVVRRGINEGYEIVGIKNGWKGLIDKDTL
jgi:6-phosphofructokinase 1